MTVSQIIFNLELSNTMKHFAIVLSFAFLLLPTTLRAAEPAKTPLVLAVLDPLAIDLACDCVQGFAQRDYRVLAAFLKEQLERPVELVFAGSVPAALAKSSQNRLDILIGKDSEVCYGFREKQLTGKRIAYLTNKNGKTTFTGLIAVASDDTAKTVADLKKHRVVFGPVACDEKYAAAIRLLEKEGIDVPKKPQTAESCTIAALEIVDNESETPVAAVISDYALTLIEGCKTIEKGALRILGKTEPVPFVGVFLADSVDTKTVEALRAALKEFGQDAKRLEKLETKNGFEFVQSEDGKTPWQAVPVAEKTTDSAKKK